MIQQCRKTCIRAGLLTSVGEVHEKHRGQSKVTSGAGAMTIDRYLEESKIERVSLIKLDVDGYECKVLRGATRLLNEQKPTIVMELCPYVLKEHGERLEELVRILNSANYRIYDETSGKELPLDAAEIDRLVADGAGINVVAR